MSIDEKIDEIEQSIETLNMTLDLRQDLIKLRQALDNVIKGGNPLGIYEYNMGQIMFPSVFIRDYVEEHLTPRVDSKIEEIDRLIESLDIKGVGD